jgi:NAD(P)-dependent dehydrogenase (short-subunit alcohol dehydrogenase family)
MSDTFAGTLFDLSGTVTIITGSTKGMGRDTARRFVQHGSKVAVSSRNQAECDAYAAELNAAAGRKVAVGIAADLVDVASLDRLVDRTVARFGRLDNLICNATTLSFGREDQVPPEDFTACLVGNIRNNYLLCKRAIPHLEAAGRGSIILVGSAAAFRADESMGVYAIAKHGMIQLMQNMASYLGPHNIRVNCIIPGFIRTDSSRPLWTDPHALRAGQMASPLRRIGEGDDIAGAAIFLCAASGNFTTGHSLLVEGGILVMGGIGSAVKADELLPDELQAHVSHVS